MNPVPAHALISPAAAEFSRELVSSDGVMNMYMHAPGGAVQVSAGGFATQTIQSVAISGQDQDYIRSIVNRLDSIIDLDFVFVGEASQADTAFYYDQEIELGESGNSQVLGISVSGSAGWELFVNYPLVANNWDYRQYVNVHEWGHSLGLEHPFEAGDGDLYDNNTDPWTSAFPEQTVMAYRSPESGDWPDFFTTSDLNALIEIWGAEKQVFAAGADRFTGAEYSEVVIGAGGNDELRGARGADSIQGGQDDDLVFGGPGRDELYGGSGNDVITGGNGHDVLKGGSGDDRMRGGFGGDLFVLSSDSDIIEDFRLEENDSIGINSDIFYGLFQNGDDLDIATSFGVTKLLNTSLTNFDIASHIVNI